MEIWSKLLPEMVDINPREVLILNPLQNKVYGFNGKEKNFLEAMLRSKSHRKEFSILF
ncbi:hypothetical protein GKODMF_05125 [Candidatus Electrothrix gigas]